MSWAIEIPKLLEEPSPHDNDLIFHQERTAIHSGRLGDVIYALPTCRALGINHLILNVNDNDADPRRTFTYRAATQLAPLLLEQSYIKKVSISECHVPLQNVGNGLKGIEFNFDLFHNVDKRYLSPASEKFPWSLRWFSDEKTPLHLSQIFAASQGIEVNLSEPWLKIAPSQRTKDHIVISLTPRWRSFPDQYWIELLKGLSPVLFIGYPGEKKFELPGAEWLEVQDHSELASLIAGSKLFIGTVSFPYAIAEALKISRIMEPCFWKPDAFPIGARGHLLSSNVTRARGQITRLLKLTKNSDYALQTRKGRWSPRVQGQVWNLQRHLYLKTFLSHIGGRTIRFLSFPLNLIASGLRRKKPAL